MLNRKMNFLIFPLILLVLTTIIKAKFFLPDNNRYCNSPYCKNNLTNLEHVNCNNTHELQCASDIPPNSNEAYSGVIYKLKKSDKKLIVDYHNKYRNEIACGKVKLYPSASRMRKLIWDEQLEEAALLNVKECDYGHDCHNTETYPYSGQIIDLQFTISKEKKMKNPIIRTKSTIGNWYKENINGNSSIIRNYVKPTNDTATYKHFAIMVSDRSTKIGCAILQYKNKEHNVTWSNVYTVCNYDSSNLVGTPVYEIGAVGSDCPNGIDKTYKCLCNN